MQTLILNGSPKKHGNVARMLQKIHDELPSGNTLWVNVYDLEIEPCKGCMKCRESDECILKEDDAHKIGSMIDDSDNLVIGTPVHWGNMSSPLKSLFDRNVPVFMKENGKGIPQSRQKGKQAVVVTACSAPWPVNFILSESRGAIRSVKKVLNTGGYKIIGKLVKPGTKKKQLDDKRYFSRAKKIADKLNS